MPNKHRYLAYHNCGKPMRSDHMQRHMNVCTKTGGLGTDKVQVQQPSLRNDSHEYDRDKNHSIIAN